MKGRKRLGKIQNKRFFMAFKWNCAIDSKYHLSDSLDQEWGGTKYDRSHFHNI
jgi:hypothetical protein